MGEKSAQVTVSWLSHHRYLLDQIWEYFVKNYQTDVEVTCNGHQVKAHKLILSIFCSNLKENACVTAESGCEIWNWEEWTDVHDPDDLNLLLEFLYRGKVTVEENRLDRLRTAAENFGIPGIVQSIEKAKRESERRKLISCRTRRGAAIALRIAAHSVENECDGVVPDDDGDDEDSHDVTTENVLPDDPDLLTSRDDSDWSEEVEAELSQESNSSPKRRRRGSKQLPKSGVKAKSRSAESRKEYIRNWRKNRPVLKCSYCTYKSQDSESFKHHIARHENTVNVLVCDTCGKTFRNRRNFQRHVRCHKNPDQGHRCEHCGYLTPSKSHWIEHLATIHQVDPEGQQLSLNVQCTECNFRCVTKHRLRAHMRWKHTMDKPFKCTEKNCNYAAITHCDLEKHVSILHKNERPFMCETCGFRSKTSSAFNRHARSHSGIKPYKCDVCERAYADSFKLKVHRLRHDTDEKQYECNLCGNTFHRRDNMQMHIKRIHKIALEKES